MRHEDKVFQNKLCDCCGASFVPKNGRQVRCSAVCWTVKNRDHKLKYSANYRSENREELRAKNREYSQKNQDAVKLRRKAYWAKNKNDPIFRAKKIMPKGYMNRYSKARRLVDPSFRVLNNQRGRLRHIIAGRIKPKRTMAYVGCSLEFLRAYIESKFKPGMTWDNYSYRGWHIDHIRPLSSYQMLNTDGSLNEDEIHAAMHYTNLQPLWAKENFSKNDKLPESTPNLILT